MPFRDCPFRYVNGLYRLHLPIQIINPHSNKSEFAWALIDTGADGCAFPAWYAEILEHELTAGEQEECHTGNGRTQSFKHTTIIEAIHPISKRTEFRTSELKVAYLPELHDVLLGVSGFLEHFILNIDYPNKRFSITYPRLKGP